MDCTTWAFVFALATQTTLVWVYMRKVGAQFDGLELAGLDTLATTYATVLALFGGKRSLVLVVAEYDDLAILGPLRTQLDNTARTGLCTCSAACTFAFVDFCYASGWIDLDGSEKACGLTVTLAKTAPLTLGLTHACHILNTT